MLTYTVGDTAPDLTGAVSASLVGATAKVNVYRPDGTSFSKTASIATPAAGTWSIAWVAGDLTVAGRHYVEVEVTFSTGAIQTFSKRTDRPQADMYFDVRPQIAGGANPLKGAAFFQGAGPPPTGLGWDVGDYYLDTTTGDLYRNEA